MPIYGMPSDPSKYKIGDFVRCYYDFHDFYTYFFDDEYEFFPYYGIIVDLAWEEDFYELETVYKVFCLDGEYRYFLEDEIRVP